MISLYRVLKSGDKKEEISIYTLQDIPMDLLPEHKSKAQLEEERQAEQALQEEQKADKVRDQVEEILNNARKEGEAIREEAKQKGFEEGYTDGFQAGTEKAEQDYELRYKNEMSLIREDIKAAIESVAEAKEEVLGKYLEDLKNISVAVAEKVIQTSLKSSGDIIKRMILSATDKLKKKSWAKIYVAKTNESVSVQGDAELLRELSNLSDNVKVIIMEEEEPGTCIVELPDEIMDVSVNTQLETIKEILNNARLMQPHE